MKKICTIAAAVALLAAQATAEVRWNETTHDFGAFDEEAGRVSCEFVFVNTGRSSISIINARASCGCTAPTFSTAPVAPGDSACITVSYDPYGRPGRFNKYVAVEFSNPSDRVKLHIIGTVIGDAASVVRRYPVSCGGKLMFSRGAVMFGDVFKDKLRSTYLTAYNSGHDTLYPRITAHPSFVEGVFEPAAVAPGEQTTLTLLFHSDRTPLYGLVTDSIAISPEEGEPGCSLDIMAMVNEDFSRLTPGQAQKAPIARLAENSLDFGTLDRSGEPATRTTVISNSGRNELKIRRIYTTDPGITVSIDRTAVKKGKNAVITVTVDPALLPGELLNARINIITNDPANPTINLRAVGTLSRQ